MNRLTYLFVGLTIGGVTYLISALFGADLAPAVQHLAASTPPAINGVASAVAEPMAYLLLNPTLAGVVMGTMWPLGLFWSGVTTVIGVIGAGYVGAIGTSATVTAFF